VINGATCNAGNTSGCDQKPTTVPVGAFDDAVTVDPVTNMVFVTNQDAQPGTVSVIDGNSCTGSHPSGCAHQPFTTTKVGSGPSGIDVNPVTNTIYVANTGLDSNETAPEPDGNTLSVIDGATCKVTDKAGCTPVGTVRVGGAPANAAIDPGTNTVYVANTDDNTHSPTGTVSVVNGADCDASNVSGCASQTPPQVPVGADPVSTAFNKATDTVYVTNLNDQTVSVINAARCNASQMSGCKAQPSTVTVGNGPSWTIVNLALHTIYEVDQKANYIAVLSTK
jgi:DNA-binding beta-propeller fold protein YncE